MEHISSYTASSAALFDRSVVVTATFLGHAGRAALTDNFDACRDLSGRRLRHVNADKKLAEWAAQAKERELEKVAAKHIRDQERAAQQEAEQQVRGMDPMQQHTVPLLLVGLLWADLINKCCVFCHRQVYMTCGRYVEDHSSPVG